MTVVRQRKLVEFYKKVKISTGLAASVAAKKLAAKQKKQLKEKVDADNKGKSQAVRKQRTIKYYFH